MKILIAISMLTAATAPAFGTSARTAWDISFERAREIEMALSAAPAHLQAEAGVFVLGKRGYERVRKSSNGFNCLVERAGTGTIAPMCFDAEGSATLLPGRLRIAGLVRSGMEQSAASALVESEYKSGKLKAPQKTGVAYMLSPEFCEHDPATGSVTPIYPPHLMFYAPYLTNAELGLTPDQIGSPKYPWILHEGTASAFIIVVPHPQTAGEDK